MNECPFDVEYCDHNDYESMCDQCKEQRSIDYFDAYHDTFD